MDWVGSLSTLEAKPVVEPVKTEAVVETKVEVEAAVEPSEPVVGQEVVEAPVEVAVATEVEVPAPSDKMVPQEILGKVLKAQREKYKLREVDAEQRIRMLEDENKRLKEGNYEAPMANEHDALITQKVREEFLMREDAYGREKYGQQYLEALELVSMQNDPTLVSRIQSAAKPADTLIAEAIRIAEELEFGATPEERQRKKEEQLKAKIKKELEIELAEKIKAKVNQPTNVQNVRSAGGDFRPVKSRDTWATGRGSLPK